MRRWVPAPVRYAVQRVVPATQLKLRYRRESNPLAGVEASDDNTAGSPVLFGIVRNASQYHTHYVSACLEMGVPFRVLDLARSDWLETVQRSRCDVLLVWPDAFLSIWGQMLKERIEVLERHLDYSVVPSSAEIWMYEDKHRMAYWLQAEDVPHPRTRVFYDRGEAERFAAACELPVVFKTSFGAAAAGVWIVRSRRRLARLVRRAFSRGVGTNGGDPRDRQWGSLLLQEYLPDVREWRMVRIGDSFFCRLKERRGEYHSGSGAVLWARPSTRLLGFAKHVTDKGGFRSMCVDVFETAGGRLLVNELQAVFGAIRQENLERGGEHMGRWRFDSSSGGWSFEPGFFYQNACANERIRDVMDRWPEAVPASRNGSTAYRLGLHGDVEPTR